MKIDIPTLPAQRELLRANHRIVAFVGGLGSGKTRAAVYKSLQLGFLNAPCVGYFVEPSYTLVKDVAIESFKTILGELGIPFKIHLTNYRISIADSFEILLRSGEEADRIVGTNAGWGIIDEPGKQIEDVGKNVLARIRDPRAKLRQLVLTGTPEGFNWFYDWTNVPSTFVVRAKTTDNPFLGSDYVSMLSGRYTQEEVNAYINGEFVRFEGGWYKVRPRVLPHEDWEGIKIYKNPDQTSGQLVIGVDTGGGLLKDSTAVAVIDKRDKSLVAVWKSNSATIDEGAAIVAKLFHRYTRVYNAPYPEFSKAPPTDMPLILVESNGIGETMWQVITLREKLPSVKIKTTEANRYAHMLESKKAVEGGIIEGPEELAIEADQLIVEDGRFKGPKDLSMALGFCLRHIVDSPYKPPITRQEQVFMMNLGRKKLSV